MNISSLRVRLEQPTPATIGVFEQELPDSIVEKLAVARGDWMSIAVEVRFCSRSSEHPVSATIDSEGLAADDNLSAPGSSGSLDLSLSMNSSVYVRDENVGRWRVRTRSDDTAAATWTRKLQLSRSPKLDSDDDCIFDEITKLGYDLECFEEHRAHIMVTPQDQNNFVTAFVDLREVRKFWSLTKKWKITAVPPDGNGQEV